VIVAAIGNENSDTDITAVYPACYRTVADDWVIGVTASTRTDTKAVFSNYGKDCADLAAPGVEIFGVNIYEPTQGFVEPYDGGWTGTSMSAPLVSGASALLLSKYPSLTPDEVRIALQLGVDPIVGAFSGKMGAGRLNLVLALEVAESLAKEDTEPKVTPNESIQVGDTFTTSSFSEVYIQTVSFGRRVFINDQTYFTYYDSFDTVVNAQDDFIGDYPLEGLVLPKAGTVLVKIQSVPTVYALADNPFDSYAPLLRAIESETIAADMYGSNWADYVIDVDSSFFTHFGMGEDIVSPEPVDISIMKTRQELADLAN
jgi:hypothetical protein